MTSAYTSDFEIKQSWSQNLRGGGAGCQVERRQADHTQGRQDFMKEGNSGPPGWKEIPRMEVEEGQQM